MAPEPAQLPDGLEAAIAQRVTSSRLVGLAIGITQHGRVIYAKGFGRTTTNTGAPITARTVFHTASLTKPFVATAVMQLVEAGKIGLDAPVVRYLPYFRIAGDSHRDITVRQMLSHTSGIPDVRGNEDYNWDKPEYDEGALERFVRSISALEPVGAPGEKFQYSNIAYDVLGDVIAKVSGTSFEDYVATYILQPLTMRDSTLLLQRVDRGLLATPHRRKDGGPPEVSTVFPYNRAHAPSSTLYSNIDDMNQWCLAVLRRDHRLLRVESFELMVRPVVSVELPPGFPQDAQIGLSWLVYSIRGHRVIEHVGADVGFRADIMIAVDDGISVVVLSNDSDIETVREIARISMDRLLPR